MTQAHGGLKSLKPNRKFINTPLGVRVSMFCHSLFQSREKTLIFTLEISTISILRHKEQSSSKISWVYEKYIGITQATYTKTALDAHKSRA